MNLLIHRGKIGSYQENSIEGINAINQIIKNSTIEIDIVPTKDNIAVLFHDLSLDRLCNLDKVIFDVNYHELNLIQDLYNFYSLEEIIKQYPNQKFLLDLRTNFHPGYFPESNIDISQLSINIKNKMVISLQKVLKKEYSHNLSIMCSDIDSLNELKKVFPTFKIDIAECFIRNYLSSILKTKNIKQLNFHPQRVHIQNKMLSIELVEIFHKENIQVYSTPSIYPSYKNSIMMIEKAIKVKADGIWLNYIDEDILLKYFKDKNEIFIT